MDSGMSLSDIAAVTRGANDENGWGSGWFLIVVLFLFMFGFGGNGWNRQGEFGQYATAASQQEILFGQQFGQLNDRLTNIGNGICNLCYEMQGGIGQLGGRACAERHEHGHHADRQRHPAPDGRLLLHHAARP